MDCLCTKRLNQRRGREGDEVAVARGWAQIPVVVAKQWQIFPKAGYSSVQSATESHQPPPQKRQSIPTPPQLRRGTPWLILYQLSSNLITRQPCIHRINGIDLDLISNRAAFCLNDKPISLRYTLNISFLIGGSQFIPLFTDNLFHLLNIVNPISLL